MPDSFAVQCRKLGLYQFAATIESRFEDRLEPYSIVATSKLGEMQESLEAIRAENAGLLNLLVRPWPARGWVVHRLPRREGGYPGGAQFTDGSEGYWFVEREAANAAVLAWAKEKRDE